MVPASPTSLQVSADSARRFSARVLIDPKPSPTYVFQWRYAAIQFVLESSNVVLRAEDRKMLLHEGVGARVLTAFVEITLDNADSRMPVDKDDVVVRRVIGLKKDEYFIDRKHCSKNEARSSSTKMTPA